MKYLLAAVALLASLNVFAQSDFDISKDKENGAVVYKGQMSFDDLAKEPSFSWLQRGSAAYKPDTMAVKYLKKNLPRYRMVVLMGTWCDDSQDLVPKLYKVLQSAGYPMAQYMMYGVDRAKTAKYIEHKLYRVERVPTIIVIKDHTEIGRIVESVKRNIEVDLVQIIQKDTDAQETAH